MAELEELCTAVVQDFPRSVFFSGKLVFQEENAMSRFLHNHTPATLQQKLQFAGLDMMILPLRIFAAARANHACRLLYPAKPAEFCPSASPAAIML